MGKKRSRSSGSSRRSNSSSSKTKDKDKKESDTAIDGNNSNKKKNKKAKKEDDSTQDENPQPPMGALVKKEEEDKKVEDKKSSKNKSKKDSTPNTNKLLSFESVQPSLSKGSLEYVLEKQNFHTMTPVQAASIPLFLSHKDVAVQACTGSGKTLAFLLPMVEMILRRSSSNSGKFQRNQVGGIVLSPTRELAHQTFQVATDLCLCTKLPPPLLLVGGGSAGSGSSSNHRPVTQDLQTFQRHGSDIIVATPGRLDDIMTRYTVLDVTELECLVLDEADVLLKMGFSVSLTSILAKLPKMRRTGLFSATAMGLKEWIPRAGMRNPVWVNVAVTSSNNTIQQQQQDDEAATTKEKKAKSRQQQQATPASLTNYYIVTPLEERLSRLVSFLQSHRDEKIIVFFVTCACVEFYGSLLQKLLPQDQYIELLHGKLVQKRREKAMERFRDSSSVAASSGGGGGGGVLCCTDVAARGLDVTDLNWVIQFDAPQDPAFFVHRVGRAARAGRKGSSLIFLTHKEEAYVDLLRMRKVPIDPLPTSEICCPPQPTDGGEEDEEDEDNKKEHNNDDDESSSSSSEKGDGATSSPGRILKSASNPRRTIVDVLPKVRDIVLKDRDMLEKGTKAFTSYVRAYKEHQCAFIFRFASLDLGVLATSFCLLRLPKMPELRDVLARNKGKLPNFQSAGPEVDIYAIPYLDKARESARQKRLQAELEAGGKNAKQIKAEQRKAAKLQKEKDRRKDAVQKGRNPDKKRGKNAQMMDEWDELAKEERLYKKLRRGKITQAEFDEEMYGSSKAKT